MNGTYAVVDLAAIRHNVGTAAKLNPGRQLCAVVKAEAYGHGAAQVSRAALEAGASYLAVARTDEAASIREAGITAPVLVLGVSLGEQIDEGIDLGLELAVVDMDGITAIANKSGERGVVTPVHIKLDTGMNRLGVTDESVLAEMLDYIKYSDAVCLAGIFTHFCVADTDASFTDEQYRRFCELTGIAKRRGCDCIMHCHNSAAIIDMRGFAGDMVREGIILYGCPPAPGFEHKAELARAMSWYATVVQVHTIKAGETVSYGRLFTATGDTDVATVSVGYADGYKRSMTGRAQVIVAGQLRPVIGTICMDMCMVDVTGLSVHAGDTVTLMGKSGDVEITPEMLGEWSGSFNYEILTSIMPRVHRVYINE